MNLDIENGEERILVRNGNPDEVVVIFPSWSSLNDLRKIYPQYTPNLAAIRFANHYLLNNGTKLRVYIQDKELVAMGLPDHPKPRIRYRRIVGYWIKGLYRKYFTKRS